MTQEFARIDDLLCELRNGRMVVLEDDEDRENEGDLVLPAQMVTPNAVNFMATHGKGLICLAMTQKQGEVLGLTLQPRRHTGTFDTAFTVSIEARTGVTTGISAPDRAHTIRVATNPTAKPDDITTPGHVFPVLSQDGGVLRRAGHTEASVDLARLAGFVPAGVMCEIVAKDGHMARGKELEHFCKTHNLLCGSIADLIAYRFQKDRIVKRIYESDFLSDVAGPCTLLLYENPYTSMEHLVLTKGDLSTKPVPVRVHAENPLGDLLASVHHKPGHLHASLQFLRDVPAGIVILIRDAEACKPSAVLQRKAKESHSVRNFREHGDAAQILNDLQVKDIEIVSNTTWHLVAGGGFGLTIHGHRPLGEGLE